MSLFKSDAKPGSAKEPAAKTPDFPFAVYGVEKDTAKLVSKIVHNKDEYYAAYKHGYRNNILHDLGVETAPGPQPAKLVSTNPPPDPELEPPADVKAAIAEEKQAEDRAQKAKA